jgi:hypothetical protein
MSCNKKCPSKKINTSKEGLQQVDLPLEEEVSKNEEDFTDFNENDLGI